MKFAQYLEDTQTPEWKRAYIDYRGLKKHIKSIKQTQKRRSTDSTFWENQTNPLDSRRSSFIETSSLEPQPPEAAPVSPIPEEPTGSGVEESGSTRSLIQRPSLLNFKNGRKSSFRARLSSFRLFRGKNFDLQANLGLNSRRNHLLGLPLHELTALLPPQEATFVSMLDTELEKVDAFYLARETEMLARGHVLQLQLKELHDHRKLILSQSSVPWTASLRSSILSTLMFNSSSGNNTTKGASEPQTNGSTLITIASSSAIGPFIPSTSLGPGSIRDEAQSTPSQKSAERSVSREGPRLSQSVQDSRSASADPDSYINAKRKLKKAVLEHYRGLEVLHNYRVLNITGFRKALKKFEKVTKIPIQDKYMTEKVDQSALAVDKGVKTMMEEMELLYATAFSNGNKKKANKHLRSGPVSASHHFSMYRSGIYLGLALPPLADGLVKVFQESTREAIPAWDVLLYLYGIILVPVLFSVLVGLNLLVWAKTRINYVFIFELKVSTRLNFREYLEMPTILLTALCYCFWMSFSLVGSSRIDPTRWPLVWLVFAFVFLFQPLPVVYRSARYWLIKQIGIQLTPGVKPVEFTDFWLGDQLCSLVFTLSNVYTVACLYADGFPTDLTHCGAIGPRWAALFGFAALPLFIRLVQSLRRYADSGLPTHLINGGKYAAGIVMNLMYFSWRHYDSNVLFALWCLSATCYSIYACSWDFLMDWSLLRLHDTKYPLLRENLLYSSSVYVYYFAMISNLLLRFLWVIYIPTNGPSMMLRSFLSGMLEMFRRVQWNFFRLENEHLGNMDQYRVTREVPLPYTIDEARSRDDKDDDDDDDDVRMRRR